VPVVEVGAEVSPIVEIAPVIEEVAETASVIEAVTEAAHVVEAVVEAAPAIEAVVETAPVVEVVVETAPVVEAAIEAAPAVEAAVETAPVVEAFVEAASAVESVVEVDVEPVQVVKAAVEATPIPEPTIEVAPKAETVATVEIVAVPEFSTIPDVVASTTKEVVVVNATTAPTAVPDSRIYGDFIEEAHLTALKLREDKDAEVRKVEQYWKNQLTKLNERYDNLSAISKTEHQAAVQDVELCYKKDKHENVCVDLKTSLLKCYKANKDRPLNCSDIVKNFSACVEQFRLEKLAKST